VREAEGQQVKTFEDYFEAALEGSASGPLTVVYGKGDGTAARVEGYAEFVVHVAAAIAQRAVEYQAETDDPDAEIAKAFSETT
jgi:hypothetical protein